MVVYADGFYQNVNTHNELAAPATGSFETKGQTILAIPPHSPIAPGSEPPNTPTHAETGLPADAFNPFNPFQQIISGGTRARLAEFGNRLFDNETNAWLSTIGIKGDKLFDGSWGYDTGFRYSQIKNIQTGTQVSASRFNRILNQADPIFDPYISAIHRHALSRLIRSVIIAIQSRLIRPRSSSPECTPRTRTPQSWPR